MLTTLLILLIVVGAALYLLRYVPLDPTIKTVIQVVVIVVVIIYLLKTFAAPLLP
jgi:hypothetical protein